MCGVDWQHELDIDVPFSVGVYGSLEALKKQKACWTGCGVVEVKMEATWIVPQDMDKMCEEDAEQDRIESYGR